MCGRFTLSTPAEMVAEIFELANVPPLLPRYNIAPTQPAPVIRLVPEANRRELDALRWGLIPAWADDPGIGNRMINARAETVATKPAFRAAFKSRRCLVVADGFYEWQKLPRGKQPFHIRMNDGAPFGMAGLWEHWEGPDGTAIETCTILTTDANDVVRPVHARMPVILAHADHGRWLDHRIREAAKLIPLFNPYPPQEMTACPVSKRVNSPANDGPSCIESIGGTSP
jgi:putative SOS response-associated peptidase YedK